MDRSIAAPLPSVRGRLRSVSVEETREIGAALGRAAEAGTVLALIGELGSGKTQLAKGVAAGLGVTSVVNSPTFVLMNEHEGRLRLFHADAYRLADPEEAVAAGLLEQRQLDGVLVVEWADRLGDRLPEERLEVHLAAAAVDEGTREIRWLARGARHERLAAELGEP